MRSMSAMRIEARVSAVFSAECRVWAFVCARSHDDPVSRTPRSKCCSRRVREDQFTVRIPQSTPTAVRSLAKPEDGPVVCS